MNHRSDNEGNKAINDQGQAIAINVDSRRLGEFIASLLGQQRRLFRHYDVVFEIDWNWLLNLDDLIIQRVAQNDAVLVEFSAKVFYENGKVHQLGGRQDFRTFRDISDVATIGVAIFWTFVIQFQKSSAPEKQEIMFLALTDEVNLAGNKKPDRFKLIKWREEELLVEIRYSNITWGEDLMGAISNNIVSRFRTRNRLVARIISTAKWLSPLIGMGAMMVGIINAFNSTHLARIASINSLWPNQEVVDLELIDRKLNYFYNNINTTISPLPSTLNYLIVVISVIVAIIPLYFVDYALPRSFLLLNEYTDGQHKAYKRIRGYVIVVLISAFIIGTASSIVATKLLSFL